MTGTAAPSPDAGALRDEIRRRAHPLRTPADLDPVLAGTVDDRVTCIGEASHGTHEFYAWRAVLTRRLVEEQGVRWIGVEGDWPDCWRLDRWVRGDGPGGDARRVLSGFGRWPTWMWANEEVAAFLTWLREWNRARPERERVGFYGLDVYSLWDSLRRIIAWLDLHAPEAVPAAMTAWQCFVPFAEDPHRYAWSTRLVPESCEADVVTLLTEVRRRAAAGPAAGDDAFDAWQNAEVAVDAERYYRIMVRGDRESWNVRDHHMVDTVERIGRHLGPDARGVVWAHNTHVGDARATDMARAGLVNVGQLLRERMGDGAVSLVGCAAHRGSVVAAAAWGEPEAVLDVPVARAGSHEDHLHAALGAPAVLRLDEGGAGPWSSALLGHRAIGVVYDPRSEGGNYVPTRMGARYDALLWFEGTSALRPLRHEPPPTEPELETEPTGF